MIVLEIVNNPIFGNIYIERLYNEAIRLILQIANSNANDIIV